MMEQVQFASLSEADLATVVGEWLDAALVPDGVESVREYSAAQANKSWRYSDPHRTLGVWLVTEAWRDWGADPVELVFQTVMLAAGAASDAYYFDPDVLRLFTFDYAWSDGSPDEVEWTESTTNWADTTVVTDQITLAGCWIDEHAESDDCGDGRVTLPPVAVDGSDLDEALAGIDLMDEAPGDAVAALCTQVVAVLLHLHRHQHLLPTTTAAGTGGR